MMILNKAALLASTLVVSSIISKTGGMLIINEIMSNPTQLVSKNAEWLELFNPSNDEHIDINGWTIQVGISNTHVIENGGPLVVAPGAYLVIGNNIDIFTNGGVMLDYEYPGTMLRDILPSRVDRRGGLALLDTLGIQVDRVGTGVGEEEPFFSNQEGASMALLAPSLDNDIGSNWCISTTPYGSPSFNTGTPGAPNDCPRLVINEIMRNPKNVDTERQGEWFELYNPTDRDVDIDGWIIKDDGTNRDMIHNGGPLVVEPDAFLILGNNKNFTTNGGVHVDYEYDTTRIFLNNDADELILMSGSTVIDRVNWDGPATGNFPNMDGASMSLLDPSLDNNVASNWCNSGTVYGNGDKGSPGAPNDCADERRLATGTEHGNLRGFFQKQVWRVPN